MQGFLYLTQYDTLLQNAADIITQFVRFFITECDSFILKCHSYNKMQRLLQIETVPSSTTLLPLNNGFACNE